MHDENLRDRCWSVLQESGFFMEFFVGQRRSLFCWTFLVFLGVSLLDRSRLLGALSLSRTLCFCSKGVVKFLCSRSF